MDQKDLSEVEARLAEQIIIDDSEINEKVKPIEKVVILPVTNESGEIVDEPLLEEKTVYPLTDAEDEEDEMESTSIKEKKLDKSEIKQLKKNPENSQVKSNKKC